VIAAQIRKQIEASIALKQALLADEELIAQIGRLAQACLTSLKAGGKIIFAGNGGSFADAQHLSAEFTSRFLFDRAPLASVVLAANNSAISAIGNDYGYEFVFARELGALAKPEDLFIAISTSGNSANVLEAVKVARVIGVTTVAWTGKSGGKLMQLCECLRIPSAETARVQECHILVGHIVCGLVEAAYFQHSETTGEQVEA
jgi:D-sedoheptulose 7-phosphate isomerase